MPRQPQRPPAGTGPAAPTRGLEPIVAMAAAAADDIERAQRLPDSLVEAMSTAGLFQLYVRASAGGPGADPLQAYHAVEALSRADGSTGWLVMVGSTTAYLTGWLPTTVLRELFGNPIDVRLAGSTRPLGTAVPVRGGYRLRGRWDFCSGIRHATGVAVAAVVGAGPEQGSHRMLFVSPSDVAVEEAWDVVGMRGTGSHDVVIEDLFVAAEHVISATGPVVEPSPLHHPRLMRVVSHAPVAGVVLGLALGALDDLGHLASHSTTLDATPLAERPQVHAAVAEATAQVESARAYVLEATEAAWSLAVWGDDPRELGSAVARARLAVAHSARAAEQAVHVVFRCAGTPAIRAENRLERRLRDLSVAQLFPAFDAAVARQAGHVLLGGAAEGAGW